MPPCKVHGLFRVSLERLTMIYGLNKKSDQVMWYSFTPIFCVMLIHHNADVMQEWLHKPFLLKLGFGKLVMYQGSKLCKTRLHNGVWTWAMSTAKNVQEAVRNFTSHFEANYGVKF